MTAQPTPPSGVPNITFTTPGSGSGGSSTYGLTSDAAAFKFDMTGLSALGSGPTTGADLLNAFVAAGSGRGDPAIIAAIQQALALSGGFYSGSFNPTPGRVTPQDAEAFAKALNQIAVANKSSPQGSGAPTMGVSQFLVQAAAAGAVNGQGAAQQKVTVYQRPDPVVTAQTFEKVVQAETGKKPTPSQTQDFVDYWTNMNLRQQKDQAEVQSSIASGQAGGTVSAAGTLPTIAPMAGPAILHPPNQEARLDTSPDYGAAPPLDASMASLSDVLNSATGGSDGGVSVEQAAPPDLAATAEDYLKEHNPNAVAAHDLGGALGQFLQLISGNGGA